ncbi:hypothetical protein AALO_G00178850 [Alosa alosa]|uniref:Cadherin domain-containing protein n=1 Tax=Alosa alosa TaxID=278164 RepID=A0AAV6GF27_9TELE|nr:hypothetical protein AALO_G00178850 [Alosa alosa]
MVKIMNTSEEDRNSRDEWYLCRLTLTLPSLSDLQWAMFPFPYLASVGPDAGPGTLVYRLSAQRGDGSQATAQFLLVEGGDDCFEVDRTSGEVRTTGRPLSPSKEYVLWVQLLDPQGRRGPQASVSILAGYRPPQFTNGSDAV